ncbi:MAG: helix-turn-helix domain-containing protein [Dehalococcoidia bacterium]|nr:helix-turn-helix domain-containing protein [Dehalococcoidia bacterium]
MSLFPGRVLSLLKRRGVNAVQRWSSVSREDMRRSWSVHIDNQVSELPGLSRSTRRVYGYLANIASRDGFCDPSAEDVANECLMSLPAATRAIKELERTRLLVSVLRLGKVGRASRSYYVVRHNKPH